MMNYSLSTGMVLFLMSLMSLSSRFKHLLSMLLSLEMAMLSVLVLLVSTTTPKTADNSLLMIFITLAVCEGSLGLSILVAMSRLSGNTLINSTTIL
uniref:NADH-ubiquinone oxidoreductase chain 4L n=1 Tax=Centruroides limpidus TaxID=6876 RepID=Q5G795_CENLI|nr:NADH dehydrogenase subunit 4L [Centruroides limpidus]AAV53591.1 NADH dehydrogenase subunit 4L [Centruroides limpidus]